ncbi:MAG TPA: DnaJ domain-containing protein [Thermoanaerobaculia bacterium]
MDNAAQRPTEEQLRLFAEKIGRRLADRPPNLDPEAHRERIAGLLRLAGESTFYQILDVPPTATAQEIHEAYDQVARLVHPWNARHLGLDGREGVLEMLFERLTQAYLTLFEPERRKEYDRDLSPEAWKAAGPEPDRRVEVARQYYDRARELAASDEFHQAIELVQQSVRADSRPEYHALLGKLQAKNSDPRRLRAAAENLQRALELGSRDVELRAALDQVQRRLRGEEAAGPEPARRSWSGGREVPEVEVVDPDEEIDVPLYERKRYRR